MKTEHLKDLISEKGEIAIYQPDEVTKTEGNGSVSR